MKSIILNFILKKEKNILRRIIWYVCVEKYKHKDLEWPNEKERKSVIVGMSLVGKAHGLT